MPISLRGLRLYHFLVCHSLIFKLALNVNSAMSEFGLLTLRLFGNSLKFSGSFASIVGVPLFI